jgi:hypothetical protein
MNDRGPKAGQPASAGIKTSGVLLTVAIIGVLITHAAFDWPLGLALLLFFVGWPLGGTLITVDDDLPVGWSNPDGTVRPPWLEASFWGQISGGLAVSALGFAIDVGWRTPQGLQFGLVSIAVAFLAAALLTRIWWLLVGTVAGIALLWHQLAPAG